MPASTWVPYTPEAEEYGFGWGCEAQCMECGARDSLKLIPHLGQFICKSIVACRIYQAGKRRFSR